jgi:hypothetical protein
MSLAESVGVWVLRNLPYDRSDPNILATLRALAPLQLLVVYLNWRDRLIPATQRRVLTSAAFNENPIVRERASTICQIIDDVEHGRDLTKYLSRRVKIGFDLPPNLSTANLARLKHLDLLLSDWGIHHLHVSTVVESDGFVERDDPLLFSIFTSQKAYFIDVMGHQDFADDHLIRIVLDTWPDEGLFSEVKGMIGGKRLYSKDDRHKQRSVGLFSFPEFDGRVFWPSSGGISGAGTSINTLRFAGHILRKLKQFENHVQGNPTEIIGFMRRHGVELLGNPKFEFTFFWDGYGAIETTSGFPIGLRP